MTCSGQVVLVTFVLVALVLFSAQESAGVRLSCQFAILAPRRLRTETVTHVVVTSYRGECTLDVILRPLGSPKTELTRKVVSLRRHGIRAVRLYLRDVDVKALQRSYSPRQVELVVQASGDPDPVIRTLDLDLHSGYLFVQTDKPVYSPGQTVHYRAIALNEQEKWARWEVQINMTDPDRLPMPLRRERMRAQGAFEWKAFLLPSHARLGVWSLSAAFLSPGAKTTHFATFEVKHYALPVFSVEVMTSPRLILDSTSNVTVVIKASYSFGKPVKGTATASLRLWCYDDVTQLQDYSQVLEEGVATMNYNISHDLFLQAQLCHLQVNAEVTESLTNQKERATSRSSIFTSTPYVITEGGNRRYYREKLPFHFAVKVKDALGEPLTNGLLRGKLHGSQGELDLGETLTDSRGQATFSVDGNHTSVLTKFTLSVESDVIGLRPDQQARLDWPGAVRLDSSRHPFLLVSSPSPVQEGVPIILSLLYNPGKKRNIIMAVWTRGRCVFKTKIRASPTGNAMFQIPATHAMKMYPSAIVVAYYFHHKKGWKGDVDTTVVSDSLRLDLGHGCRYEINISTTADVVEPRSTHTLTIKGSPGATYAVWAVDNNVYLVNPSRTVSREKVFEAFSEYGQKMCNLSHEMADGFEEKCFHLVSNVDLTSGSRSSALEGLAADEASWTGGWPEERDWGGTPVYKYFPESWLFFTGTLSKDGKAKLNVTYPDSLTTWSITVMGVATKGGLCVAPPLLVSVNQIFSASLKAPPTLKRMETGRLVLRVVNADRLDMRGNIRMTSESDVLCWEIPDDGRFNDVSFRRNNVTVWTVDVFPIAVGRHKVKVTVDITQIGILSEWKPDYYTLEEEINVVGEGEIRKKLFRALVYPHIPLSRDVHRGPGPTSSEEDVKAGNRRKRSVQNHSKFVNLEADRCELQNDGVIINEVQCEGGGQTITMDVAPPVGAVPESVQVTASLSGLLHHSPQQDKMEGELSAKEALTDVSMTLHALLALSDSHFHQAARENAVSHLTEGITSLLGFRLENGAFSLTQDGKACAWLTALAVGTLCRSRDHVQVEPEVWKPGLAWVQERSRNLMAIPAEELRPSSLSERDQFLKLTTDVLLAAHYCGEMMEPDEFITTVSLLSGHVTSSLAPTVLGHVAFGLSELITDATSLLSGVSIETQQRLVRFTHFFANKSRDLLMATALTTSSGMLHWSVGPDMEDGATSGTSQDDTSALDIEATAFALLTLLRHEIDVRDLVNVFRWLVERRQPDGFFVDCIDTIIASQALAEFHRRGAGDVIDLSVSMTAEEAMGPGSVSLDSLQWLYQAEHADKSTVVDLPLPDPGDGIILTGASVNVGLREPTEVTSIEPVEVPALGKLQFQASGNGMAILCVELTYCVDVDLPLPEKTAVPLSAYNPNSHVHIGDVILGQSPMTTRPVSTILETFETPSPESSTLQHHDVIHGSPSPSTMLGLMKPTSPDLTEADQHVQVNSIPGGSSPSTAAAAAVVAGKDLAVTATASRGGSRLEKPGLGEIQEPFQGKDWGAAADRGDVSTASDESPLSGLQYGFASPSTTSSFETGDGVTGDPALTSSTGTLASKPDDDSKGAPSVSHISYGESIVATQDSDLQAEVTSTGFSAMSFQTSPLSTMRHGSSSPPASNSETTSEHKTSSADHMGSSTEDSAQTSTTKPLLISTPIHSFSRTGELSAALDFDQTETSTPKSFTAFSVDLDSSALQETFPPSSDQNSILASKFSPSSTPAFTTTTAVGQIRTRSSEHTSTGTLPQVPTADPKHISPNYEEINPAISKEEILTLPEYDASTPEENASDTKAGDGYIDVHGHKSTTTPENTSSTRRTSGTSPAMERSHTTTSDDLPVMSKEHILTHITSEYTGATTPEHTSATETDYASSSEIDQLSSSEPEHTSTTAPEHTSITTSEHISTKPPHISITNTDQLSTGKHERVSVITTEHETITPSQYSSSTSAEYASTTTAEPDFTSSAEHSSITPAKHRSTTPAEHSSITTAEQSYTTTAEQSYTTKAKHSSTITAEHRPTTPAEYSSTTIAKHSSTTTAEHSFTTTTEHSTTTTAEHSSTITAEYKPTTPAEYRSTTTTEHISTTSAKHSSISPKEHISTTTAEHSSTTTAEHISTTSVEDVSTTSAEHSSTTPTKSFSPTALQYKVRSKREHVPTTTADQSSTTTPVHSSTSTLGRVSRNPSNYVSITEEKHESTTLVEPIVTTVVRQMSTTTPKSMSTPTTKHTFITKPKHTSTTTPKYTTITTPKHMSTTRERSFSATGEHISIFTPKNMFTDTRKQISATPEQNPTNAPESGSMTTADFVHTTTQEEVPTTAHEHKPTTTAEQRSVSEDSPDDTEERMSTFTNDYATTITMKQTADAGKAELLKKASDHHSTDAPKHRVTDTTSREKLPSGTLEVAPDYTKRRVSFDSSGEMHTTDTAESTTDTGSISVEDSTGITTAIPQKSLSVARTTFLASPHSVSTHGSISSETESSTVEGAGDSGLVSVSLSVPHQKEDLKASTHRVPIKDSGTSTRFPPEKNNGNRMESRNAKLEHGQQKVVTSGIKPVKESLSMVEKEISKSTNVHDKATNNTPHLTGTVTSASVDINENAKTHVLPIGDPLGERVLKQSQTPGYPETNAKEDRLWSGHLVTQGANIEITRGGTDDNARALTSGKESGASVGDVTADGHIDVKGMNCRKHHIHVNTNSANVTGKDLCEQCKYDCEEEGMVRADRSDDSSHVTPVCSQPAKGNAATLVCVEVCISRRLEDDGSEFQATIHLQQGFCLYDSSDLDKLKSRPSIQEVKVMNGTDIYVTSSQAFCVRFRQVTWQPQPHEPGVVHVTDTKKGEGDCVQNSHGGHDRERHLPAYCHDVTSTPIGQCHCLQKTCPDKENTISIRAFMDAINGSTYVHYLELRSVRRGTVTAHLEFSLRETYKDVTARALNSTHVNTTLHFVVSLKCMQGFMLEHTPSPGQGYWVMGKVVHRMNDLFVYSVTKDVVAVKDSRERGKSKVSDCMRRNYLISALDNIKLSSEPLKVEPCPQAQESSELYGTTHVL